MKNNHNINYLILPINIGKMKELINRGLQMKIYEKVEFYILLILGVTFIILMFKKALLEAIVFMFLFISMAIKDICIDAKLDIDNNKGRAAAWVLFNDILGICLTIYNFIFGELLIGIALIIFILVITYQSIMILKK